MKTGFVGIFGKPNSGKSTLLNAILGEKLAIVSPKVQTTRHRIKGILTGHGYQLVLSDTPGIIQPRYKLHEKMMQSVKLSMQDADLALLVADAAEDIKQNNDLFSSLRIKIPAIVAVNKADKADPAKLRAAIDFFRQQKYCHQALAISALRKTNIDKLLDTIISLLPLGEPFFDPESLTDLPTRFFVAEMIREKIFLLYAEEIPYHATVVVQEFKEKASLTKIGAEIIVQRDTQKGIILGENGKMIKQLGIESRKEIEAFLGTKILLQLFVKVRPRWRDNELYLKEYGY